VLRTALSSVRDCAGTHRDTPLTLWAIRDQIVTEDHARTISKLYFSYIDKIAAASAGNSDSYDQSLLPTVTSQALQHRH